MKTTCNKGAIMHGPDKLPSSLRHHRLLKMKQEELIRFADGSSKFRERGLVSIDNKAMQGTDWFLHPQGRRDRPEDHHRRDEIHAQAYEIERIDDGRGSVVEKRKSIEKRDDQESHGIEMIGRLPESGDPRRGLLSGFNSGTLFDGKDFGSRLLGKPQFDDDDE